MKQQYFINKFITSLVLGINSGLSYALIGSTFTIYLNDSNIDLATIGLLSLRAIPYSFKYLWAPIIDNVNIKLFRNDFGQRKMWIISIQLALIISILSIGLIDIEHNFKLICILSFFIAFLSASYDIAMEAYRIELFKDNELSRGSLTNILGFRIGLLTSGAGGLYISSFIAWKYVFLINAIVILPCMLMILFSKDDRIIVKTNNVKLNDIFNYCFIEPIKSLSKISNFYVIIIAIACYKLSDYYLDTMLISFFLDVGYSKTQIATIVRTIGIGAGIFGTIIGSYIIGKIEVILLLFITEILSALSNLLFIILTNIDKNNIICIGIVIIENIVSGISNIVLITYMSSLCNRKFTATHYALLASISSIFRILLSSSSGIIAKNFGWNNFFISSSLLSIPSLICFLHLYRKKIKLNDF